jgi:hypothetical protein
MIIFGRRFEEGVKERKKIRNVDLSGQMQESQSLLHSIQLCAEITLRYTPKLLLVGRGFKEEEQLLDAFAHIEWEKEGRKSVGKVEQ